MEKEFIKYEQALALKELGFSEPCFKKYIAGCLWSSPTTPEVYEYIHPNNSDCLAPIYQQVFRWFREKYNIQGYIYSSTVRGNKEGTKQFTGYVWNINEIDMPFISTDARDELHDTYEEAENACIDKLIEIAKQDNEQ